MSEFWKKYHELAKKESGGGGIIGKVRIETGYKVFVSGLAQDDCWFPFDFNAAGSQESAKNKSAVFGAPHGASPKYGVQIRAIKESCAVRGQPASWQDDRFFFQESWTEAATKVVVPSLEDNNIETLPWEGWARLGFKPDPYKEALGDEGKTDTDADGNPRFPQVCYVVETFKSKEEAQTAIAGASTDDAVATTATIPATTSAPTADVDVPEGWTADVWQSCWPDIRKAAAGGKAAPAIAQDFGISPRYVIQVLNS